MKTDSIQAGKTNGFWKVASHKLVKTMVMWYDDVKPIVFTSLYEVIVQKPLFLPAFVDFQDF